MDYQINTHRKVVWVDSKDHMVPLKEDYHNIHHSTSQVYRMAHTLFLGELREDLEEVRRFLAQ